MFGPLHINQWIRYGIRVSGFAFYSIRFPKGGQILYREFIDRKQMSIVEILYFNHDMKMKF